MPRIAEWSRLNRSTAQIYFFSTKVNVTFAFQKPFFSWTRHHNRPLIYVFYELITIPQTSSEKYSYFCKLKTYRHRNNTHYYISLVLFFCPQQKLEASNQCARITKAQATNAHTVQFTEFVTKRHVKRHKIFKAFVYRILNSLF